LEPDIPFAAPILIQPPPCTPPQCRGLPSATGMPSHSISLAPCRRWSMGGRTRAPCRPPSPPGTAGARAGPVTPSADEIAADKIESWKKMEVKKVKTRRYCKTYDKNVNMFPVRPIQSTRTQHRTPVYQPCTSAGNRAPGPADAPLGPPAVPPRPPGPCLRGPSLGLLLHSSVHGGKPTSLGEVCEINYLFRLLLLTLFLGYFVS